MLNILEAYAIVTPESAEQGDYDETGVLQESTPYTLRELVHYIQREGYVNASAWPLNEATDTRHVWLEDTGTEDYKTGAVTYRTLHFDYYSQPAKAKYWHAALILAGVIK